MPGQRSQKALKKQYISRIRFMLRHICILPECGRMQWVNKMSASESRAECVLRWMWAEDDSMAASLRSLSRGPWVVWLVERLTQPHPPDISALLAESCWRLVYHMSLSFRTHHVMLLFVSRRHQGMPGIRCEGKNYSSKHKKTHPLVSSTNSLTGSMKWNLAAIRLWTFFSRVHSKFSVKQWLTSWRIQARLGASN